MYVGVIKVGFQSLAFGETVLRKSMDVWCNIALELGLELLTSFC